MDKIRDALEDCSLTDLGFAVDPFTCRNNSHSKILYISKRGWINVAWRTKFPNFKVINGEPRHFDHRPMIVLLENPPTESSGGARPRPFRFEAG